MSVYCSNKNFTFSVLIIKMYLHIKLFILSVLCKKQGIFCWLSKKYLYNTLSYSIYSVRIARPFYVWFFFMSSKRNPPSLQASTGMWQKNKKKKKRKSDSRQSLIRKLDRVFSQYIRLRDSDDKGMIKCVSCPSRIHRKKAHSCHFVSRSRLWYRRDEKNCHAGCPSCNTYRQEMHMRNYTTFMIDNYWRRKVDKMLADEHKIQKVSIHEIRAKLEVYKKLVKEMMT